MVYRNGSMSQPVLTRQWIKIFSSGTALPQFDPETGLQNAWGNDSKQLAKVLLVPFSPELASKVLQHGIAALATTDPVVEFVVQPTDTNIEAGLSPDLSIYDPFECDICGTEFPHNDPTKYAQCPQCGATDDWHCSRCNQYKYPPFRIGKRGEVQCPDCDIAVGLDREKKLFRKSYITHIANYFVKCDRCRLTVLDNGKIVIE
jgi:DNA-directed RNA polymerase subunit RPC12/RpoP